MFKPEPGVAALLSAPSMTLSFGHERPVKSGVTKNTYLNFKAMQAPPSVRQLHQVLKPVTGAMLCSDVLKLFLENESLAALPVIDQEGKP